MYQLPTTNLRCLRDIVLDSSAARRKDNDDSGYEESEDDSVDGD